MIIPALSDDVFLNDVRVAAEDREAFHLWWLGQSGYLLEPKDYQGFADRIVHLLKNPKQGEELGKNAREMVRQKYLITRLLSDYLDMLNDVINGTSSRR